MREEARDFRLISTALSPESRVRTRDEEQEKLSQGSIQTIHQQLYYNLDLLRTALGLQTCALLWLDESGERLKVKELCTDSTHVAEGAISRGRRRAGRDPEGPAAVRAGVAAAVAAAVLRRARRRWARSSACRSSRGARRAASWSRDRVDARKFEAPDDRRWSRAPRRRSCASCSRSACSRRVERSKHEHERFYSASAELNRALTLDEVYDAAIAGARGVCEFDFAAIATYDARRGSHTIRRVVGEGADNLLGTTHKDPSSIASMVAKNKLALPAGGDWRERDVPVFSHPMRIKDYESLLVLPLHRQGRGDRHVHGRGDAHGRVPERPARHAGRHRQPGRDLDAERAHVRGAGGAGDDRRPDRAGQPPHLPGALRDHARPRRAPRAVGVAAADRHRSLQEDQRQLRPPDRRRRAAPGRRDPEGERAQDRHRRALRRRGVRARARGHRPRRRASSWPSASARRSSSRRFPSAKGSFNATLSIGVASYPDDARDKPEIIARADQALYSAKHGGRNRTVCFTEIDRGKLKVAK